MYIQPTLNRKATTMFAIVTLVAMFAAPANQPKVQTLPEIVVVSDTVRCHKRDLVQGSGSVVTCERK